MAASFILVLLEVSPLPSPLSRCFVLKLGQWLRWNSPAVALSLLALAARKPSLADIKARRIEWEWGSPGQ